MSHAMVISSPNHNCPLKLIEQPFLIAQGPKMQFTYFQHNCWNKIAKSDRLHAIDVTRIDKFRLKNQHTEKNGLKRKMYQCYIEKTIEKSIFKKLNNDNFEKVFLSPNPQIDPKVKKMLGSSHTDKQTHRGHPLECFIGQPLCTSWYEIK